MKIMVINTLYFPCQVGGAEVSVQLLCEQLQSVGHTVRVVCLHEGKNRVVDVINGVEIVYLPLKNIYWPFLTGKKSKFQRLLWHILDLYNPFMKRSIDTELNDFKPDVVHTNNLAGFSIAVWDVISKKSIPLVHTARDYYLFHPNCTLYKNGETQQTNSISVLFWGWIKKVKSRKVDVIIGISQFVTDLHLGSGYFPSSRFGSIYNPVDVPTVSTLPENKLRIGFIGRLSEEKGFDSFCDLAREHYNNSSIKFIAAGRFNNDRFSLEYKKQANDLNIELLGFTPLSDFLSVVDIVVLPVKWNEPFGRTIVECALANKIVLTNARGGIKELMSIFPNVIELTDSRLESVSNLMKEAKFVSQKKSIFKKEFVADKYLCFYRNQ